MTTAHITDARVAAGHDGSAELVVSLCHDNGGTDRVTLTAVMAERLLAVCGVASIDALAGQSWRHLMQVLDAEPDRGGD